MPLEKEYNFHAFHSPALNDADFDARPMVMLVGPYSTGKTTFIRYLLEKDFPGISYMKMIIIIKSIRLFNVRTKNFMQAIKV